MREFLVDSVREWLSRVREGNVGWRPKGATTMVRERWGNFIITLSGNNSFEKRKGGLGFSRWPAAVD